MSCWQARSTGSGAEVTKRPVRGPGYSHLAFIVQYGPGPYAIPKCVTDEASMFLR